jgi:transposase
VTISRCTVVRDFFNWCLAERDLVLDDSPMDAAIGYAINQQKALERFLDDGRLPMTNNISERNLRKEAVGRKNWIFVGSEDGATANTTFVSLIASCELHGIEPWRYLRDLFYLLPDWPKSRVLELAPAYFEQTLQQEEAKRRLAENPLRRALLAFAR